MEFAKKHQVQPGDILVADGGFDCLKKGVELKVHSGQRALYVECAQGKHFIDVEHGRYVGFFFKPRED